MTDMNEIITESLWNDVETWFDGIEATLSHRCYQPRSMAGIRAIQRDVRKHLAWIDVALLEIETRSRHTDDDTESISDGEHLPPTR